jgi:hypothetical protein
MSRGSENTTARQPPIRITEWTPGVNLCISSGAYISGFRQNGPNIHRRAAEDAEETFFKNTDFRHVILCVLCELRVSAVSSSCLGSGSSGLGSFPGGFPLIAEDSAPFAEKPFRI